MILKKVVNGNKIVYEPISFEDALNYEKKEELQFTDEDERDEFEDRLDELEDLDYDEDDFDDEDVDFEEEKKNNKMNFNFGDLSKMFDNFSNFFNKKKTSKSKKLIAALPFLDADDLHEIVEEILKNSSEYQDLDLVTVMPFLSQRDCDKLFMRLVVDSNNRNKSSLAQMGPFISNECLSNLVDEYIKGNYQDLQIDTLYPFMSSKDVKRLFTYIITKKDDN